MAREQSKLTLARRVRGLGLSPTAAVMEKAAELRARGERVLDFSVGEPDQPTPVRVVKAMEEAARAGRTRYTASSGLPELRRAVAERYRIDTGADISPAEVVVASGGKHALALVWQALVGPRDEVVVPTPGWPTFSEAVRISGGTPVLLPTREKDGFRLRPDAVRKVLTPRTRAVVVNTPCNPTGAVMAPDDLLALGRMARRHGFFLLYDDTYAALSFGDARPPLRELREAAGEWLIIVGTASKTYCMTGWRIGWLVAAPPIVKAAAALVSHSTQCPAAFAQAGAVEAMTGPQDDVRTMLAEYKRRRDNLHPEIASIPGVRCLRPEGAFYFWLNVEQRLGPSLPTTLALASRFLEEQKVAVVPGEGFSAPGYLRISFARSLTDLQDGVARLRTFLGARR